MRCFAKCREASKSNKGLSSFLAGQIDEPEIIRSSDYGFDYVPVGAVAPNPAELLTSIRARGFIENMASRYDQVIIDGPPILGIADALELSKAVDAVAYVIQANAGTRRAISLALARLHSANANIIGGVVTQLDERNQHYGYGYEYGYGYGYSAKTEPV